jgi:DNA-binding SARP family transcriptional activator
LLALLLIDAGRPVPVDRLIDELWVGDPPVGAETTIRSYLSRLRRVLGDDVVITGGAEGYALEAAVDEIDAVCFERLVREGEEALDRGSSQGAAERLVAALSLWRGRPFGELADEGALRLEADRLDELRLRALEKRFDAELALGKSAELVEELEGLAIKVDSLG